MTPGRRSGAVRPAPLFPVLACALAMATAATADPDPPWHLSSFSRCTTCLQMESVWQRYGVGHASIAVVVAEPATFADTRAAGSWHAGIAARQFELQLPGSDHSFVPPEDSEGRRDNPRAALDYLLGGYLNDSSNTSSALGPGTHPSSEPSVRKTACSFVRAFAAEGPRNHDLQMVSLIGGQPYLGTSGVAPGTHVILTSATLDTDGTAALTALITRRPDVRVVNLSQGQGRVVDEIAVASAHPHGVQYQQLNRLVMELSIHGMMESRLQSATRFLVVAAAGNVPAFESDIFEPEEVLDFRIPPEAIHFAPPPPEYIDLRPHYLRDIPHVELPLLVVGAIGPYGRLPSYARVDKGIDIYAPAGRDWIAQVRAPKKETQSLGGAAWAECACAVVGASHRHSLVDDFPALTVCKSLDAPDDRFQLGIPTLDFHANIIDQHTPSVPLPALCAAVPLGLCTSLADGTSAATALVSGVAALMFALDPTQSGEEVARILKSTARTDNPLSLPVVYPRGALDAVARGIGARLLATLGDSSELAAVLGLPFYYTMQGQPPLPSTKRAHAADYVTRSFASLGQNGSWRVTGLRDARLHRCGVGMAGSTLGIGDLLQGGDPCADTDHEVETLRLELDVSNEHRHLVVGMALRRAGPLGPDADWRFAGLSISGN